MVVNQVPVLAMHLRINVELIFSMTSDVSALLSPINFTTCKVRAFIFLLVLSSLTSTPPVVVSSDTTIAWKSGSVIVGPNGSSISTTLILSWACSRHTFFQNRSTYLIRFSTGSMYSEYCLFWVILALVTPQTNLR